MKDVAISGVGIVLPGEPAPVPWPMRAAASSHYYRPARAAGENLAELVARASALCGTRAGELVVLGSCNGAAETWNEAAWRASFDILPGVPVATSACASGLHALYLGRVLVEAGAPGVTVVAADLATAPAHRNFDVLRVLSDAPAPFQPDAPGFLLGEAAVALRLVRAELAPGAPRLIGPVLEGDLDGEDGLDRALGRLALGNTELVIGQGTGPMEADRAELAAIARHIAPEVPLATALASCGHTIGASSLLSVALAVRARDAAVPALAVPFATALDGRPLAAGPARTIAIACRALGGACGACVIGDAPARALDARPAWGPRSPTPPLRDPVLRTLAVDAEAHRPAGPPDLLVVTLDAPLVPTGGALGRILPSSVLEMTPGTIARLVARQWGFRGTALCLVGGDPRSLLEACRATHQHVYRLAIRGMEERDVEWNA
jgi:hypothetical protein